MRRKDWSGEARMTQVVGMLGSPPYQFDLSGGVHRRCRLHGAIAIALAPSPNVYGQCYQLTNYVTSEVTQILPV